MTHDEKMMRSLSKEQRKWVLKLLALDATAVEARESFACAWAFELGRAPPEKRIITLA